jgi:UDP-glucose 4-epimerase
MKKNILVTGGAGYIGSHTCVELLQDGYSVIVVDNLCNSQTESLHRIEKITGKSLQFYQVDIRDKTALAEVFSKHEINAVIHFAGLKAVGESCEQPLVYYQNNVTGTLTLLEVMAEFDIKNLVFSSSATVYGDPHKVPITEEFPLSATNPYGHSKLMVENICQGLAESDAYDKSRQPWKIALLRYFNPVGAHESGLIGEDPNDIPNNLLPYISQVAVGKLKQLSVFGHDYSTKDGTGVRDYIHVVDLAKGHLKALAALNSGLFQEGLCRAYNLGTGNGYSVLEMVNAFQQVSGQKINYKMVERRAGDVAECYAEPQLAQTELGWKAERGLETMMEDAWRWQKNNPEGYRS